MAQRRHRGEIADATERDYRKHAAKLKQVFGVARVADIDVPMLVRWRDVRGKSPTQFNHERTVFRVAIEHGMVDANPVAMLGKMKTKPRDRYVTDEEVMDSEDWPARPLGSKDVLACVRSQGTHGEAGALEFLARATVFIAAPSEKTLQVFDRMVAGDGIEPPTRGFSIPCSTN